MIYGSVCSGIESASVAWEPLGWSPAWFSEVEPFPSAVLAHHWPDVANLGDMTQLPTLIAAGLVAAPDILVGGTPCQAFSVAGMRKGLDDERGQLTIKYVEVANEIDRARPDGSECIAVWENVPGVLSSKDNAFGCFLGALVGEDDPLEPAGKRWTNAGIVYGPQRVAAWRVLDAQYFGVAQRRRRVFVVASARDGFDPAAVLFESESLRRDTPPSREEGPVVAALTANGVGTCGADDNQGQAGHLVAMAHGQGGAEVREDGKSPTLTCNHETPIVCHGSQDPLVLKDKAFPIGRNGGRENVVAFQQNASGEVRTGEQAYTLNTNSNASGRNTGMVFQQNTRDEVRYINGAGKIAGALAANAGMKQQNYLQSGMQVRRLTPVECERLQGFPDERTRIAWRKKLPEDCPDGPRYKAIGNSKAVPVIRWVGERIKKHLEATP